MLAKIADFLLYVVAIANNVLALKAADFGRSSQQTQFKKDIFYIGLLPSPNTLNPRAHPTNGSDCGSLRSHNLTLFVMFRSMLPIHAYLFELTQDLRMQYFPPRSRHKHRYIGQQLLTCHVQ